MFISKKERENLLRDVKNLKDDFYMSYDKLGRRTSSVEYRLHNIEKQLGTFKIEQVSLDQETVEFVEVEIKDAVSAILDYFDLKLEKTPHIPSKTVIKKQKDDREETRKN
jgi:hypothetical protein